MAQPRMTATEELRRLLDEHGVEWWPMHDVENGYYEDRDTEFLVYGCKHVAHEWGRRLQVDMLTPEQAIAATLGREPWVNPTWERWHNSLRHDEIKSIGDAVEQLMYEAIEFGGDMGPNGNTYNGIDEGDVLTSGFINEWIARFESTLGREVRDRLRAENDKLRELVETQAFDLECMTANRDHLYAENAKLRELVRKMMQFFEDGDWCTTCELVRECEAQEQYEEDCLMRGVFHDRMRELRIGVDA